MVRQLSVAILCLMIGKGTMVLGQSAKRYDLISMQAWTTKATVSAANERVGGRACFVADAHDGAGEAEISLPHELRGKRIRILWQAAIEGNEDSAVTLVASIKRPPGVFSVTDIQETNLSDNLHGDLLIDVLADSVQCTLTIKMEGTTRVCFEQLEVQETGREAEGFAPPRGLSGAGMTNLVAFAHLFGLLRYFHPSDGGESLDWERFAIHGIEKLEGVTGKQELAEEMQALVQPFAPTVRVLLGRAMSTQGVPSSNGAYRIPVRYYHVGFGDGYNDACPFCTIRGTDADVNGFLINRLQYKVDLTKEPPAEVTLTARVRYERTQPNTRAIAWLANKASSPKPSSWRELAQTEHPREGTWENLVVRHPWPKDGRLWLGVALMGLGELWVDTFSLQLGEKTIEITNADFAMPSLKPSLGWEFLGMGKQGFVPTSECQGRGHCLHFAQHGQLPKWESDPVYVAPLGEGLHAYVPTILYADELGRTFPQGRSHEYTARDMPISPRDRTVRLASVIICWNAMRYFYSHGDDMLVHWPSVLRDALSTAATDSTEIDFDRTLAHMGHRLRDGHGYVRHPHWVTAIDPPFHFGWVEGEVVVTAANKTTPLEMGDIITHINGYSAQDMVRKYMAYVSGATFSRVRLSALQEMRCPKTPEPLQLTATRRASTTGEICKVSWEWHPTLARTRRADRYPPHPENGIEVAPGVVYLAARDLTASAFEEILPRLRDANGIILDSRMYPKDGMERLIQYLLERPVELLPMDIRLATSPNNGSWIPMGHTWWPEEPRLKTPVVWLVNAHAISQPEYNLSVVAEHQLGPIVGSPSGGSVGNAVLLTLPTGHCVYFTNLRARNSDGTPFHGIGIQPTVIVEPTIEDLRAGRDTVLERAIAILTATSKSTSGVSKTPRTAEDPVPVDPGRD